LLVAPFSLSETARATGPVRFAGTSYDPEQPLDLTYTFNSYRLAYRWRFFGGARSEAWVGFTAKLRDAKVALAQGERASRKDDLGFVPLLHLAARRQLTGRLVLDGDADALAGGPGRAVDASIKVGYQVGPRWSVHAGYRAVEGGADVEDVYTFAWIHYAVVSFRAGL
jgi:hypothetical protein